MRQQVDVHQLALVTKTILRRLGQRGVQLPVGSFVYSAPKPGRGLALAFIPACAENVDRVVAILPSAVHVVGRTKSVKVFVRPASYGQEYSPSSPQARGKSMRVNLSAV